MPGLGFAVRCAPYLFLSISPSLSLVPAPAHQEEVGYGLDQLIDVALGDDGSVAFAGYTSSNYYVVLREQETGVETWALEVIQFSTRQHLPYFLVRRTFSCPYQAANKRCPLFSQQGEASGVNNARAVARGEDGSILVAGERDVGSYYAEEPGFYVVKLDSNGTEMWSFQVRNCCCRRYQSTIKKYVARARLGATAAFPTTETFVFSARITQRPCIDDV